jgi:hypothetical protein
MTHLHRRRIGTLLTGILFISALLPRLCAIGRYVTPDELNWIHRGVRFREALLDNRWGETLVSGHPGVTTAWAGALGIGMQLAIRPADRGVYEWITHLAWLSPDLIPAFPRLASFLTAGRLVVAVTTSLGVVAIYLLAQSLFGQRAALLAGFLLALDPFTAGLSGLLHVDGLVATLSTLSLLALMAGAGRAGGRRSCFAIAAAGGLAALAALTKSPAALLVPFSGLVLFGGAFGKPVEGAPWRRRLSAFLGRGGVWAVAFLVTAVLVLPALWAAPAQVLDTVLGAASRHAGSALRATFFLGQVALDHGPLFYPVVLLYRLGPLILVGLVAGVWLFLRGHDVLRSRSALTLALWVLLFLALITPAAKKFDRYALPAIPPLILLAALAWEGVVRDRGRLRLAMPFSLVLLQAALLLLALPYPLAAFNRLLGGADVAERVMAVDWGEGIGAAARWLAAQPGAGEATATASNPLSLAPFFPGRTVPFDTEHIPQADYLILDINSRQLNPAGFEGLTAGAELRKVVRLGGIDHAWVYQQINPEPPGPPVPELDSAYLFGERVQLLGIEGQATSERARLTVRWGLVSPGGRYTVYLTLRDGWGHEWGTLEAPLLNEVHFYPEHWEAGETPEVGYTLNLPAGIPPAEYAWELSLYDSENGARLPLRDSEGGFHGVMYRYAGVSVPFPAEPPSLGKLQVPVVVNASWLDNRLTLLGHASLPDSLLAGEGVDLELYWRSLASLPDGLSLRVTLGEGVETLVPLSRTPSGQWQPGGLIREKYTLMTPPELPAGSYFLAIAPTNADGSPLEGAMVTLGGVEVISPDRLFELPEGIPYPLDYRLEGGIRLRGLDLGTPTAAPGGEVRLTLFWQAEEQPAGLYTAFVHLIGPAGSNVAQDDRWPAYTPSSTWAAGQVIRDEYAISLPEDAPAGGYQIAVGLYDASTGLRLAMTDAAGAPVPDNRLVLPAQVSVGNRDE